MTPLDDVCLLPVQVTLLPAASAGHTLLVQLSASCRPVPAVLRMCHSIKQHVCVAGAGAIPATDLALMRAHIMAWLLYTTPAQLQRQLGAFGLDIAEQPHLLKLLQSELAGSFPVLRCLARLDAGDKFRVPVGVSTTLSSGKELHAQLPDSFLVLCNLVVLDVGATLGGGHRFPAGGRSQQLRAELAAMCPILHFCP